MRFSQLQLLYQVSGYEHPQECFSDTFSKFLKITIMPAIHVRLFLVR